jgi:hypothetical protein
MVLRFVFTTNKKPGVRNVVVLRFVFTTNKKPGVKNVMVLVFVSTINKNINVSYAHQTLNPFVVNVVYFLLIKIQITFVVIVTLNENNT